MNRSIFAVGSRTGWAEPEEVEEATLLVLIEELSTLVGAHACVLDEVI
jgi:hypothetical protein